MEKRANIDGKWIHFDVECFRFGNVRLNELHIAIAYVFNGHLKPVQGVRIEGGRARSSSFTLWAFANKRQLAVLCVH